MGWVGGRGGGGGVGTRKRNWVVAPSIVFIHQFGFATYCLVSETYLPPSKHILKAYTV